jgi:hypothetical protein
MKKYQNLINNITPKCLENNNYSIIVGYSLNIKDIYYNNLFYTVTYDDLGSDTLCEDARKVIENGLKF